jgi:hypothetical protein
MCLFKQVKVLVAYKRPILSYFCCCMFFVCLFSFVRKYSFSVEVTIPVNMCKPGLFGNQLGIGSVVL